MKPNLIKIQKEITQQVDGYLQKYYKTDSAVSYLRDFVLEYLSTCRYSKSRHDDVRPLFVKLGFEIAGGKDSEGILPAMSAIHLLLLSSIPLDDVIDGIERQNNYTFQGLPNTIAKAYSISSKLREDCRIIMGRNYRNLNSFKKIDEIISYCVESQDGSHTIEVIVHDNKLFSEFTLRNYFEIVDNSTSALLAESFVIGGLLAGLDKKTENIMRNFGMALGRLAQIRDDYIDYIDPKFTGKFPLADLYGRRKRFPILTVYWFGNKKQKRKAEEIFKKEKLTDEDICDTMDMILDEKIRNKAQKIIEKTYKNVPSNFMQLPKHQPAYSILNELVNLFYIKVDTKQ